MGNTKHLSVPEITIMASLTSPPESPTKIRRDTGFPEPFHGDRNTTLPHPDANLAPNASISQDDLHGSQVLRRTRRSFLAKHRRTLSHGYISPLAEAVQQTSMLSLIDTHPKEMAKVDSHFVESPRFSKDESESSQSRREDETPPASPDLSRPTNKQGRLRKWRMGA